MSGYTPTQLALRSMFTAPLPKTGVVVVLAHPDVSTSELAFEWRLRGGVVLDDYSVVGMHRHLSAKHVAEVTGGAKDRCVIVCTRDSRVLDYIDPREVPADRWWLVDDGGAWRIYEGHAELMSAWHVGLQPLCELLAERGWI